MSARPFAAVLLVLAAPAFAASDGHPSSYVDEGACPFECCTYREWKAELDVRLHSAPKRAAAIIGTIRRGESVLALTGEVVTTPARFIVKRDHGPYRRGDRFWVYTYLGEGYFKIWRDGTMQEEELDLSPYEGGTGGDRCQESPSCCWGELDRPLKMTWWIKIRDRLGSEGWTSEHDHFSGADACG